MIENRDSAEGTNTSGSSTALTNLMQDEQQDQQLPLEMDHQQQQPQPLDERQQLQEQPQEEEQDPAKLQRQEQEEPKLQQGDQEQHPVEERQLESATQDKLQQQPERREHQLLQELPREEGQQDQQQQQQEQQQVEEQQQEEEQQHQEEEEQQQQQQQQEDERQEQEEQQQEEEQQQQEEEEQQQQEDERQEQEEQQQQQQEQQQQDALPPSAGQREQDGSHPRKEKSRLSKPVAASSPRLDFIPKPAEPPVDNLIPIRLDIEADGQRYKDVFTWNTDDPDTEIAPFVRRLVKDMNLPIVFAHYIAQSMQTQIGEYRATDNQRPTMEERIQMIKLDLRVNRTLIHDQFLWDVNNPDSDPEEFAKRLCEDLELDDPEIAPAIAVSIREQIHEINKQISSSGRDTRISKKVRRERGVDYSPSSNPPTTTLNLMRRPNNKISVLRRRNEWDSFEPVIEQLTDKEMEALYAREERTVRLKKQQAEKEDVFGSRYGRM